MGQPQHPQHPGRVQAPSTADDARWLARAVELAVANVGLGGGPFGAVVVRGGEEIAVGQNQVTRDLDPTAHAEVVAIRAACRALGSFSLAGCTLFSSCEPCPLCQATALWARLDRLVFAADRHDAARAGFDDSFFHDIAGTDPTTWPTPIVRHSIPGDVAPMDAWLANPGRAEY